MGGRKAVARSTKVVIVPSTCPLQKLASGAQLLDGSACHTCIPHPVVPCFALPEAVVARIGPFCNGAVGERGVALCARTIDKVGLVPRLPITHVVESVLVPALVPNAGVAIIAHKVALVAIGDGGPREAGQWVAVIVAWDARSFGDSCAPLQPLSNKACLFLHLGTGETQSVVEMVASVAGEVAVVQVASGCTGVGGEGRSVCAGNTSGVLGAVPLANAQLVTCLRTYASSIGAWHTLAFSVIQGCVGGSIQPGACGTGGIHLVVGLKIVLCCTF